jgi:hypothetical protein
MAESTMLRIEFSLVSAMFAPKADMGNADRLSIGMHLS